METSEIMSHPDKLKVFSRDILTVQPGFKISDSNLGLRDIRGPMINKQ